MAEEDFDTLHGAVGAGSILGHLNTLAFAGSYPHEIEPFGQCSVALLRHAEASLRINPGDHLVDLGCGRGGPGLWLARQSQAKLTGVDFSRVALAAAARRAAGMRLSSSATFQFGYLTDSGLPAVCADALICIDALLYANDRIEGLREVGRLLRPGGRALVTVAQSTGSLADRYPRTITDWRPLIRQADLTVVSTLSPRGMTSAWARLGGLWLANARRLRHEVGTQVAAKLLAEAKVMRGMLEQHQELAFVLTKP